MFIGSNERHPLYKSIADSLQKEIAEGGYLVGGLLPTEVELSQHYGVCRQTVRDALRILSDNGLVRRRRRVGTIVIALAPTLSYVQPLHNFQDLLHYARNTRLTIDHYGPASDSRLTRRLELRAADWILVEGLRGSSDLPVAATTALVRRDCAPTRAALERRVEAFSKIIERTSAITTCRVEQEITAASLTTRQARALRAIAAAPALRMLRRYFDQDERLYLISDSVHPANRFTYTMSYHRSAAADG